MDGETKLWALGWSLLASVVISIVISVTISDVNASLKLTDMVKAGADPVKARCALYGSGSGSAGLDCNLAGR